MKRGSGESLRMLIRRWWREINLRQRMKGESKYGTYRPELDTRDNLVERMKEQVDAPAYLRMEEEKILWRARSCARARAHASVFHVKRWRINCLVKYFHALAVLDRWCFALTVAGMAWRDRLLDE